MREINKIFLILILVFLCGENFGQSFHLVHKGKNRQASLYDIARTGDNEFWIGGKNATLLIMDDEGDLQNIDLTKEIGHILRIVPDENYIWFSTTHGFLFRFDKKTGIYSKFEIFPNKPICIYDILLSSDGKLVVAGGARKITAGRLDYPRGFIALIDKNNPSQIQIKWNRPNAFVFALTRHKGEIVASAFAFPSMNSSILYSADEGQSWKKKAKVKGIVHALASVNDELFYSGSPDIFYYKNGMFGSVSKPDFRVEREGSGCFHGILGSGNQLYLSSYRGWMESVSLPHKQVERLNISNTIPLYRMMEINDNRICAIGHACTIYFLNKEEQPLPKMSDSDK